MIVEKDRGHPEVPKILESFAEICIRSKTETGPQVKVLESGRLKNELMASPTVAKGWKPGVSNIASRQATLTQLQAITAMRILVLMLIVHVASRPPTG
jgi:hypothetical protein